jgi:hypothetical protein
VELRKDATAGAFAGFLWLITLIAFLTSASGLPEMVVMASGWTAIATFRLWRHRAAQKRQ